ncbi:hypothetical protein FHS91_000974 [Sphingobium xanthum]|uniref:hypothetical protein n=1 Tax=Sphingobium xanthum TaxID=1387165 RepID=UPI001C8B28F4|nr:hypothetical protein [Sphingobium xanthum]
MTEREEAKHFALETEKITIRNADTNLPVIFADVIRGAIVSQNVLKINLAQLVFDPVSAEPTHQLVASIALPLTQAAQWGELLTRIASENSIVTGSPDVEA